MIRRHRLLALVVVVALAVTACSRNNAKRSDVVSAMRDAGLNQEQSNCIGDGIDAAFGGNQKLYNDVAAATTPEALDKVKKGASGQVKTVLDKCLGKEGAGSTSTTTGAGTSATTTTTKG